MGGIVGPFFEEPCAAGHIHDQLRTRVDGGCAFGATLWLCWGTRLKICDRYWAFMREWDGVQDRVIKIGGLLAQLLRNC